MDCDLVEQQVQADRPLLEYAEESAIQEVGVMGAVVVLELLGVHEDGGILLEKMAEDGDVLGEDDHHEAQVGDLELLVLLVHLLHVATEPKACAWILACLELHSESVSGLGVVLDLTRLLVREENCVEVRAATGLAAQAICQDVRLDGDANRVKTLAIPLFRRSQFLLIFTVKILRLLVTGVGLGATREEVLHDILVHVIPLGEDDPVQAVQSAQRNGLDHFVVANLLPMELGHGIQQVFGGRSALDIIAIGRLEPADALQIDDILRADQLLELFNALLLRLSILGPSIYCVWR